MKTKRVILLEMINTFGSVKRVEQEFNGYQLGVIYVAMQEYADQFKSNKTGIDKDWIFEIMNKTSEYAKVLIEQHFERHQTELKKDIPSDEEIQEWWFDEANEFPGEDSTELGKIIKAALIHFNQKP